MLVTPTINKKALSNEQIEAMESESNTQNGEKRKTDVCRTKTHKEKLRTQRNGGECFQRKGRIREKWEDGRN